MRTLNNNQLSGTLNNTKSNAWNSKRRFRQKKHHQPFKLKQNENFKQQSNI